MIVQYIHLNPQKLIACMVEIHERQDIMAIQNLHKAFSIFYMNGTAKLSEGD